MTTAIKTPAKKRTGKKTEMPPVPPSAQVVDIGGRDYLITPFDEYSEWCEDQWLGAIVEERINKPGAKIVPFTEIM